MVFTIANFSLFFSLPLSLKNYSCPVGVAQILENHLEASLFAGKKGPSGHQFAFSPGHISQKQLPRLLVQHETPTIQDMCVLQNLRTCHTGLVMPFGLSGGIWISCFMWLILWHPSLWCALMVLMQHHTLQRCLPPSQLCCCSLSVSLAALSLCQQGGKSPPAACSLSAQSASSRGSWCCGWQGSQLLARGQGLQVRPRLVIAPSTAEGSGHRYCLSCPRRGESPTVISHFALLKLSTD